MPNDTDATPTALWPTQVLISHFFLYPFGQDGLWPLIFLTVLPLMQMIVFFLGAACVEGVWVGVGDGSALIGVVTTGSSFVLFVCHCAL